VSAKDRATGKEQSIRIEAKSGLSESEIQNMVKDAESHAAEDQKRKESVESRNRADQLAYEVEKNLKEHGDKLDGALKARVQTELDAVREALKSEDSARIDSASESLQKVWHEAAGALYQNTGTPGEGGEPNAPPPGAEGGEPRKKGDGAVDADYEVMN